MAETQTQPQRKPITLQGPEPNRFGVKDLSHAGSMALRVVGSGARLFTGSCAEGYSVQLVAEPKEGAYYVTSVAGRYMQETANPMSDKLKQPIQLY